MMSANNITMMIGVTKDQARIRNESSSIGEVTFFCHRLVTPKSLD